MAQGGKKRLLELMRAGGCQKPESVLQAAMRMLKDGAPDTRLQKSGADSCRVARLGLGGKPCWLLHPPSHVSPRHSRINSSHVRPPCPPPAAGMDPHGKVSAQDLLVVRDCGSKMVEDFRTRAIKVGAPPACQLLILVSNFKFCFILFL